MKRALCFSLILTLFGCGSSLRANPEFKGAAPKLIALLPIKFPNELREPRKVALNDAVIAELRNAGFLLVEPSVVNKMCANDPSCPNRAELTSKYGVDAFAEVDIDSASTNNFLAGYVDRVSGTMKLVAASGEEIVTAKHAETDAGGLLFNSGQVITGLQTEVKNFDAGKFTLLANRFAKRLVSTVPRTGVQPDAGKSVTIASTEAKLLKPRVYEVCANGTADSIAALSLGKRKTNLREIAPGRYCGIYRLEPGKKYEAVVELRSVFGNVARMPVAVAYAQQCELEGRLSVRPVGKGYEVDLREPCKDAKVLVYRGDAKIGPYQKIGEIRGKALKDSKATSPIYQVISVTPDGSFSLPVEASPTT